MPPREMTSLMEEFLEWSQVRNYSERTVKNRRVCLVYFINWCAERELTRPNQITKPILERYQTYLFHYRNPKTDKPLTFRSQSARLVPVRAFFKWLTQQNYILYNPASELELPRSEKRLPRSVLTISEAEQVLNKADAADPLGIRDRAILETFYSTGIRRLELCSLSIYDLDAERGTMLVRQGKGRKDRMIPIGARAIAWCEKYIREVRPSLLVPPDDGILF